MQRKSLALVAIAITLLSILFLQLTVVQAAVPQQVAVPSATDEPEQLVQPIRIRIRQTIPLTISLAPTAELTATAADVSVEIDTADAPTATEDVGIAPTNVLTATAETASAESLAATAAVTETAAVQQAASDSETVAATEELTPTETLTASAATASVPVILAIEFDFVVTQTLTTTVPASATLQLPDFQTRTVPISVVVAPLADGELLVEIVPAVAQSPELPETEEITAAATATATATVELSPTVLSTLATEVNGIPVVNTAVNAVANLRAGPGTTFEIVSEATPGQPVQIAAVSEEGAWYLLATGAWIAAFLVDEQPANIPTVNDQILAAIQGTLPEPTPMLQATPVPAAAQAVAPTVTVDANLRSGPGTTYSLLGSERAGAIYRITGKSPDGAWWQIDYNGREAWVFGQLAAVTGGETVAIAQNIPPAPTAPPAPPPTNTPVPQPTQPPAPTAAPKPQYKFNIVVVSRCERQPAGNWFEGTTYINGQPQNGYKVAFSYAADGPIVATIQSGPHEGYPGWKTGYYSHIINATNPQAGNWFVWVVDQAGQRISEVGNFQTTGPGEGCNQAVVDFDSR